MNRYFKENEEESLYTYLSKILWTSKDNAINYVKKCLESETGMIKINPSATLYTNRYRNCFSVQLR